ncbi:MAG: hypothetical protein JEY91_15360 [Spirochaetaceae bacterium]|nr:hypothetical protein [Spirochaetaceae bacterium]
MKNSIDDIYITGKLLKSARIKDEWYRDITDPELILEEIRKKSVYADIFTFRQRLPDSIPHYKYHTIYDSIAALRIHNYTEWWNNQINSKTRNAVRRSEKMGVEIKKASFNDEFISGMVNIFNETKIRQGKSFWHYGKDFDTVKSEFSRNLHREEIFGAYYERDLIGFLFLAFTDRYAMITQILSFIRHRNKSVNNALMATAVKVCSEKHFPYLVYAKWPRGSLADFKRHNGFKKVNLPVFYIPLTLIGKIALKLNLQNGIRKLIPDSVKNIVIIIRKKLKSLISSKKWK